MKRIALCVAMLAVGSGPFARAQDNPWNGQWKADPSSLKYTGPEYKVTVDPDGYTVVQGGKTTKIVCDGKPQKTDNGTMTSCSKSGDTYMLDVTRDGKQVRKTTLSLSADGKKRISKSDVTPPDAAPYTMNIEATRVSGGPGFAGEWRETKFGASTDNGMVSIQVNGDSIAFKETDSPEPVTAKLDGTDTKFGMGTMSARMADPHTLKITYKDTDGVVRRENTFALSADGKSITETDVTPAPAVSKMVIVLHKM